MTERDTLDAARAGDSADSDASLVRRYQRGDAAAFSRFVLRHQDRVFRFARALLWRREDADDVTQEVFLRSLSGLQRFLFLSEPSTWLLKVTRNVCREHNRRLRQHEDLHRMTVDEDAALATDDVGAEDYRRLRLAVRSLPERQREVVVLRMFEDLSVRDTAIAMGCREGTVKAHLNKAVGNLRALMNSDTRHDETTDAATAHEEDNDPR